LLVLTRKPKQSIMIGDDIEVTLLSTSGEKVRLGIQAPPDVAVYRTEIYIEIQQQRGARDDREDASSEVELNGPPEQGSAPDGGPRGHDA
jgi:carbon storage regulator